MAQGPAAEEDLTRVGAALGATLPTALRDLYLVSDGVWDATGQWFVIWPLADVAECNHAARQVEGAARKELIGFGDDGTGNPFCVRRAGGDAIYYWGPILKETTRLADDLESFWTALWQGTLPPH